MYSHPFNMRVYDAYGVQQKPAKTSSKARWVEAKALKPGDVIVWCMGALQSPVTVEAVRFGWWRKAYVQAQGNIAAFVVAEDLAVKIAG